MASNSAGRQVRKRHLSGEHMNPKGNRKVAPERHRFEGVMKGVGLGRVEGPSWGCAGKNSDVRREENAERG